MTDNRRLKTGYSDLGPIQIPPRPQAIVLTDRANGSKWLVTFNTSNPERLSISSVYSTIQRREGLRIYEADDGPKMDEDGEFTLIIRNGRIGFDFTAFSRKETARDDSPPYARQSATQRKLIMSSVNPTTLHLGYDT